MGGSVLSSRPLGARRHQVRVGYCHLGHAMSALNLPAAAAAAAAATAAAATACSAMVALPTKFCDVYAQSHALYLLASPCRDLGTICPAAA